MSRISSFGRYLSIQRIERGMTQSDLMEKTGYTHAVISQYEGGSRIPSEDAIKALAKALNVKRYDLESRLPASSMWKTRVFRQMEGMRSKDFQAIYDFIRDKIGLVE